MPLEIHLSMSSCTEATPYLSTDSRTLHTAKLVETFNWPDNALMGYEKNSIIKIYPFEILAIDELSTSRSPNLQQVYKL